MRPLRRAFGGISARETMETDAGARGVNILLRRLKLEKSSSGNLVKQVGRCAILDQQ